MRIPGPQPALHAVHLVAHLQGVRDTELRMQCCRGKTFVSACMAHQGSDLEVCM